VPDWLAELRTDWMDDAVCRTTARASSCRHPILVPVVHAGAAPVFRPAPDDAQL